MRNINYILIHASVPESGTIESRHRRDRHCGYHYVVNDAGVVLNPIEIRQPGTFAGTIRNLNVFDQRDYNASSIGIQFNGELTDEVMRTMLIDLLVDLRLEFPSAKILGVCEIDGKSIKPNDEMNRLRLELSNEP